MVQRSIWTRNRSLTYLLALLVVVALIGSIFLLTFLAQLALGPRGDLFPLLSAWLLVGAVWGFILFKLWRFLRQLPKWVFTICLLVLGGLTLLGTWRTVRLAGDMFLPPKVRDVIVASAHYHEGTTSRSLTPDFGTWHLVTSDGADYGFAPFRDRRLRPGPYRLRLSRIDEYVISADPK